METNDKKYEAMREHVRIDVKLPISIKFIPNEERYNISTRVFGYKEIHSREVSDSINMNIYEALNRIEKKIDMILNILTIQQYGFYQLPEKNINISGGGISFISDEFFVKGDILEIKIFLDEPIPVGLLVYGEVVRVVEENSRYNVGVKFININEKQRDIIVRFVMYKQRQSIRDKKLEY